ncbi:hypothetical protein SRHO_G00326210 [Serrasalmus rhombeus]
MHAAESELRALDSALRVCARWRRAGGDGQALQQSSRRAPDSAALHALETDASALQMRAPGERRATLPTERRVHYSGEVRVSSLGREPHPAPGQTEHRSVLTHSSADALSSAQRPESPGASAAALRSNRAPSRLAARAALAVCVGGFRALAAALTHLG